MLARHTWKNVLREWMGFEDSQAVKEFFIDITFLRAFFFVLCFLIRFNHYNGHPNISEVCSLFSNPLHSHYAVVIHLYQLVKDFDGRKLHQYKPHKTTSSVDQLSNVIVIVPQIFPQMASNCMTPVPPSAFSLNFKYNLT